MTQVKSMYRNLILLLKPCPFCGGEPKLVNYGNKESKKIKVEIKCTKCHVKRVDAALTKDMNWLEDTALGQWNKRTNP